jgi:UDPglucose--hexose-1-phosphate uridylyltransferase
VTELRQDPTTNEWVIIAHARSKRPYDFSKDREIKSTPAFVEDCSLCPGNENMTPPEVAVYRQESGTSPWLIRVVPNLFPALSPSAETGERLVDSHFKAKGGFGFHEVIIETPHHNQTLPKMGTSHVELVLQAYRDRYKALSKETGIRAVLIFKNHGVTAGTSLSHPHSQIIAAPIVSTHDKKKLEIAKEHYSGTGRCLYCDINSWELENRNRLVFETDRFAVFHPYASHYPFETWISPKKHEPCFGNANSEDLSDLAEVLPKTLRRMDSVLGEPDFNYVFHTAPVDDEGREFLHWYIQLIPRIWTAAGFEIGTGIYINTSVPEETAKYMKEA